MKHLLKIILTGLCVTGFLLTGFSVSLLFILDAEEKRKLRARITSFYSRIALRIMNVQYRAKSQETLAEGGTNALLIANHLSYLDILILSAIAPSTFVSSLDLKQDPFLGKISVLGGTLFVDRKRATGIRSSIKELAHTLAAGHRVVLFPEATSTGGKEIRPFKSALLQAAEIAEVPVVPVCIKYTDMKDKGLRAEDPDLICYYGDMTFLPHLIRLLALDSIQAEISFLENKCPDGADRKELATYCHSLIRREYFTQSLPEEGMDSGLSPLPEAHSDAIPVSRRSPPLDFFPEEGSGEGPRLSTVFLLERINALRSQDPL